MYVGNQGAGGVSRFRLRSRPLRSSVQYVRVVGAQSPLLSRVELLECGCGPGRVPGLHPRDGHVAMGDKSVRVVRAQHASSPLQSRWQRQQPHLLLALANGRVHSGCAI